MLAAGSDDVRGIEEPPVAALSGLLPERSACGDGRRRRPREAAAAVPGGGRHDRVVPAGEVVLAAAPAGMRVRLVLVVDQGVDGAAVFRPGRRDPAGIVVGRRVLVAARRECRPALDPQAVEIRTAERAVHRVQAEHRDRSVRGPERPHGSIRHVVAVTGVAPGGEHRFGCPDQGHGDEGWLRRRSGDGGRYQADRDQGGGPKGGGDDHSASAIIRGPSLYPVWFADILRDSRTWPC